MIYQVHRYHDFSMGHRVVGHEGACSNLHGHNYRIIFYCEITTQLDSIGRVVDFSCIKELLCNWLEENWDHKMVLFDNDPLYPALKEIDSTLVSVPFNPTAENIGAYLLTVIAPQQLKLIDVICTKIIVQETRKCSATIKLE